MWRESIERVCRYETLGTSEISSQMSLPSLTREPTDITNKKQIAEQGSWSFKDEKTIKLFFIVKLRYVYFKYSMN